MAKMFSVALGPFQALNRRCEELAPADLLLTTATGEVEETLLFMIYEQNGYPSHGTAVSEERHCRTVAQAGALLGEVKAFLQAERPVKYWLFLLPRAKLTESQVAQLTKAFFTRFLAAAFGTTEEIAGEVVDYTTARAKRSE